MNNGNYIGALIQSIRKEKCVGYPDELSKWQPSRWTYIYRIYSNTRVDAC